MKSIIILSAMMIVTTCAWGESFYGYNTETKEVGIINDSGNFIPNRTASNTGACGQCITVDLGCVWMGADWPETGIVSSVSIAPSNGMFIAPVSGLYRVNNFGMFLLTNEAVQDDWKQNALVHYSKVWLPSNMAYAVINVTVITNVTESDNGVHGCRTEGPGWWFQCAVMGCDHKLSVPATERYRVTEVIERTTFRIEYGGKTHTFTEDKVLSKKRVPFHKRDVWEEGIEEDIMGTQRVTFPDGKYMDLVGYGLLTWTNTTINITNVPDSILIATNIINQISVDTNYNWTKRGVK